MNNETEIVSYTDYSVESGLLFGISRDLSPHLLRGAILEEIGGVSQGFERLLLGILPLEVNQGERLKENVWRFRLSHLSRNLTSAELELFRRYLETLVEAVSRNLGLKITNGGLRVVKSTIDVRKGLRFKKENEE